MILNYSLKLFLDEQMSKDEGNRALLNINNV